MDLKDPANLLLISIVVLTIASFFVGYYPEDPMVLTDEILLGFQLSVISHILLTVIMGILLYYMHSLYRYIVGPYKEYIYYIFMTILLIFLSTIVITIRIIDLLVFHSTGVAITFGGFRVYIDPVSIAVSSILVSGAFFFYYLYGYYYKGVSPRNKVTYALLVFYIISFILIIHPDNNYSELVEEITVIKIVSRIALLLTVLIPVIFLIINLLRKLKTLDDRILRERTKLMIFGNLFIILTLVFYILDGLTPTPYSIFITFGYISEAIGVVLIGISIIAPEWYVKFVRKVYKE